MRALLDGGIPLVAVSFDDSETEPRAHAAKAAGVDVAELRVDRYAKTDAAHVLAQVDAFKVLPVLATIRSTREGGEWRGTEAERLELFRALAPQVQAVDIELSSGEILADVIEAAHRHDTVAIVSYHNFDFTPARKNSRPSSTTRRAPAPTWSRCPPWCSRRATYDGWPRCCCTPGPGTPG